MVGERTSLKIVLSFQCRSISMLFSQIAGNILDCFGRFITENLPNRFFRMLSGKIPSGTIQNKLYILIARHSLISFVINAHIPPLGRRICYFYRKKMHLLLFFYALFSPIICVELLTIRKIIVKIVAYHTAAAIRKFILSDKLKSPFRSPFCII